ncbi:hypothetical protein [Dyella sp. 2RAB6]|uniref:hypothetical protein n=1 Tax=Dyella sp. 2RAB6 TaxID=3232992 RepID=UPI003F8FC3CF
MPAFFMPGKLEDEGAQGAFLFACRIQQLPIYPLPGTNPTASAKAAIGITSSHARPGHHGHAAADWAGDMPLARGKARWMRQTWPAAAALDDEQRITAASLKSRRCAARHFSEHG